MFVLEVFSFLLVISLLGSASSSDIENDKEIVTSEIATVKEIIDQKFNALSRRLSELERRLNQGNDNTEKEQSERHLAAAESIAFAATYTATETFQLEPDATMPYSTTTLTEGSGYDPDSSVFTCPVHGLYYFSASGFSSTYYDCIDDGEGYDYCFFFQYASLGITKNDVDLATFQIAEETRESFDYMTNDIGGSSNSIITECLAGEQVRVRAAGSKTSHLSCPIPGSCVFSGFLILLKP